MIHFMAQNPSLAKQLFGYAIFLKASVLYIEYIN